MKQIIYIYVIHHATNQLCNKQNINLELSRFSVRSVFVGKLSDGIWLKKFLENMSQDAKDVVPGGLSPLKPADAEVQKICDQVSVLSPLNFEMPCLAIADNPSINPSWKACVTIIVWSVGLSEMRERGEKRDTRELRQKHYISSLG